MKSINNGSGNKTLNNVHRLSEMVFAVKRVIKVGVFMMKNAAVSWSITWQALTMR